MEERIRKWEEEIARIAEKQKEMNQKSSERIRELRKKIQEAEQAITLENNRLIAEAVREVYGEMDKNKIEDFRKKMEALLAKAGKNGKEPDVAWEALKENGTFDVKGEQG